VIPTLPATPSLEQLKKQAKELLCAYRAGDPEAVRRIRSQLTAPAPPSAAVRLASVLHTLAREYGFASWPKLKQHVEALAGSAAPAEPLPQQVERLGARDWRVILAADEALARAGQAGREAAIAGLAHPHPRVRRGCASFLDHQATDACVPALWQVALKDAVPAVRRAAVHALGCQRCKPSPLASELVALLVQVVLRDPNMKVRQEATWILGVQPPDARAIAALEQILREETDPALRKLAHRALKQQDPRYRQAVDARAREQGIARARAASVSP
jgi:HEAT repeat protein